jgi:hypothetical protein
MACSVEPEVRLKVNLLSPPGKVGGLPILIKEPPPHQGCLIQIRPCFLIFSPL